MERGCGRLQAADESFWAQMPLGDGEGRLEQSVLTSLCLDGNVAVQNSCPSQGLKTGLDSWLTVTAKLVELKIIIIKSASSSQPLVPMA